MAGTGQVIEEASRNTNIDDAFALGVWWTQTNDGAAGVGLSYRNPGGVRSSAGYAVGGGGIRSIPRMPRPSMTGLTLWIVDTSTGA